MKKIFLIASLLFSTTILFAAKTTIIVKGNCGECKERIEEAAYKVKGVKKAEWNKKTKELHIVFNEKKTTINTIETAIAKAGHDTEHATATEKDYKQLPSCCAYRDGNSCHHD